MTTMCSSLVWLRMEATLRYWASVETTATRAPESISRSGDLVGGQGGVDGYVDSAQHQGGEVDHGPLPAILGQQRDAIAFDDAPGEKDVGQGIDASHRARRLEMGCQLPDASCHRIARSRLLAATNATTSTRVSSLNMNGFTNPVDCNP